MEAQRGSDSMLSAIWGFLIGRKAKARKQAITDLRDEAHAALARKGVKEDAYDHRIVNKAAIGAYGTSFYVLSNLVKHLPNHNAEDIVETCLDASIYQLPEDELLTDEHVNVRTRLHNGFVNSSDRHRDLFQPGPNGTSSQEHRAILAYAMTHIEDEQFIVHAVYERGAGTLEKVLDILPVLKASGHRSLSEGAL